MCVDVERAVSEELVRSLVEVMHVRRAKQAGDSKELRSESKGGLCRTMNLWPR